MSSGPAWRRPDEVMKLRQLKVKKRALQARMKNEEFKDTTKEKRVNSDKAAVWSTKRKNPFKNSPPKRHRTSPSNITPPNVESDLDLSTDNTLFQLLNSSNSILSTSLPTSFTNILSQQSLQSPERTRVENVADNEVWLNKLPVDWSLKTRIRFTSETPFTWNQNLKTSEEASGITSFVRCLDLADDTRSIDSSINAQFHQCCLVWQHPSLPWLQLFPRTDSKASSHTSVFNNDMQLQESLHRDWTESFRSLFQLVKARQCPYLYLCASAFTCLIRAAGIAGNDQIHAIITPTTRGLRESLKNDDIVFSMPLRKSALNKRQSGGSDSGFVDTSDSTAEPQKQSDLDENVTEKDGEDDEEPTEWLQSIGIETENFPQLNPAKIRMEKEQFRQVDGRPESLVYVEGVETQALFNFLLNARSCIATTGPLAGVPPTLLAPVSFHGATLRPLKVKQCMIRQGNNNLCSVELTGPILPSTVHNLCTLLQDSVTGFTASMSTIEDTSPFCKGSCSSSSHTTPSVFGQENLCDCGLQTTVLARFCEVPTSCTSSISRIQYKNEHYSCR